MQPHTIVRPTYARVDLGAVAFNFGQVRNLIGPKVAVLGVVKADAYGHGAVPVARCLEALGVEMLGVAIAEEALALREAGLETPVVVLGQVLPEQVRPLIENDVSLTVSDFALAEVVSTAARRSGLPGRVHVKVDTGMGRLGILEHQAAETIRRIATLERVILEGVATHFSSASDEDPSFTHSQVDAFRAVLADLEGFGLSVRWIHAANSAALVAVPESRFNMVRPGLLLYGLWPAAERPAPVELRPALSLHTRVVLVKDLPAGWPVSYGRTYRTVAPTRVAVITLGYNDGYSRRLSNRGWVRIRGRLCPVIGRVCMDQCVVDVTAAPGVRAGDEVQVYEADRRSPLCVERIAEKVETVPHEVLCQIGRRVPRVYVDSTAGVDLEACTRDASGVSRTGTLRRRLAAG